MAFECIQSNQTQHRLRLIAFVTALTSVILSFTSIHNCTFILSGAAADPDTQLYAWGLFTTPVYDHDGNVQGCIPYPSSVELGPTMKTAQAFGILLVIFMPTVFLGLFLVQFFLERGAKSVYHIIKVLLPSSFCCQLLTFASFASNFCSEIIDEEDENKGTVPATCVPGGAGTVAIFNLVAIIVMIIVMSMTVPPDHPVFQLYGTGNSFVVRKDQQIQNSGNKRSAASAPYPKKKNKYRSVQKCSMVEPQRPGREKIKTTIIHGPDVRKTIKEISHANGSQTITTTIEEMGSYQDDDQEYGQVDDVSLGDASTILEVL